MSLIESARHVLEHKQFVCIDADTGAIVPTPDSVYQGDEYADLEEPGASGNEVILDAFTASLLTQVYDALSPAGREKFDSLPPLKCVDVCWKLATKEAS